MHIHIFFSSVGLVLLLYPHYSKVIMSTTASQIAGVWIVYSNVCSCADRRKCQCSASLAFVRGIYRWPVDTPHKGLVTQKCFHLMSSLSFNVSIQYHILCKSITNFMFRRHIIPIEEWQWFYDTQTFFALLDYWKVNRSVTSGFSS